MIGSETFFHDAIVFFATMIWKRLCFFALLYLLSLLGFLFTDVVALLAHPAVLHLLRKLPCGSA